MYNKYASPRDDDQHESLDIYHTLVDRVKVVSGFDLRYISNDRSRAQSPETMSAEQWFARRFV